ncbi:hypothetical protein T12_11012 [Trichinella patagoniensis]|uniref:Uncharacterized protein n=1 Tax=Trichinella patagoniensis TaxID=990121 RepID=A0A0V0W5C1_9BILA|nr:hypothetical protein T12_11012 [Trichinella patagoniensis]
MKALSTCLYRTINLSFHINRPKFRQILLHHNIIIQKHNFLELREDFRKVFWVAVF